MRYVYVFPHFYILLVFMHIVYVHYVLGYTFLMSTSVIQ
jgi:hypothetical protein